MSTNVIQFEDGLMKLVRTKWDTMTHKERIKCLEAWYRHPDCQNPKELKEAVEKYKLVTRAIFHKGRFF